MKWLACVMELWEQLHIGALSFAVTFGRCKGAGRKLLTFSIAQCTRVFRGWRVSAYLIIKHRGFILFYKMCPLSNKHPPVKWAALKYARLLSYLQKRVRTSSLSRQSRHCVKWRHRPIWDKELFEQISFSKLWIKSSRPQEENMERYLISGSVARS